MSGWVRIACLTAWLGCVPAAASAEWQIKPFGGITFGGGTTFALANNGASPDLTLGGDLLLLGEVLGLEADFAHTPGFFENDQGLILSSYATSLTGNVVIAMPRRMTQYTLRPYLVAGLGFMHVDLDDYFEALSVARNLTAFDVGGGATGFLNETVGLNFELRYFRTIWPPPEVTGLSVGPEQVSFWRATMGLTIRP